MLTLEKMVKLLDVQNLFQEIGFDIRRINQEITLDKPLSLGCFFQATEADLRELERSEEFFVDSHRINNLDYILKHPNGYRNYLKIVDWDSAVISREEFEIFNVFPEAVVLSMKSYLSDPAISEMIFSDDSDPKFIDQIRETFFQIHRFKKKTKDGIMTVTSSLQDWLKKEFNISKDRLVEQYIARILMGHRIMPDFEKQKSMKLEKTTDK
jgi:dimeric dUTPase (all-alpha-NTP-PPase superfamily)